MISDPLGGPDAADVISSGGEDFSDFAASRWPGLVRQAFAMTGDQRAAEDIAQVTLGRAYLAWRRVRRMDDQGAYLRRILARSGRHRSPGHEAGPGPEIGEAPAVPVAPVDSIIRRGRDIRRRRVWVMAGSLGLAGVVAAAILVRPSPAEPVLVPHGPPLPVTVPAGGVAGADGVFARGTADGHAWQLAVQNIADPGYRCIPAITINGTDADPVYPAPGNGADVTLGPAAPGIGFAFVQVPDGIAGLVADGRQTLPVITATACGLHYRLTGFAYRLTGPPRITAVGGQPGWPKRRPTTSSAVPGSTVPIDTVPDWPDGLELPLIAEPSASAPQTDGMWSNVGRTSADNATGEIAAGKTWSITLMFSVAGDCYAFSSQDANDDPEVDVCGPISTRDGPETIMALPLSLTFPPLPAGRTVPTGYAVRVSPATAHLRATLSDGSTQLVTPRVVDGRRYAAFYVASALRLKRLTWLDAAGQPFASTTALPRYGYTQFQP